MRSWCAAAAGAMLAATIGVEAQWLNYPTPGVPRLADGSPNLAAPAPRTADGKVDLSGVWQLEPTPCGGGGCTDYPGAPELANLGRKLAGGLPYQVGSRPGEEALGRSRTATIRWRSAGRWGAAYSHLSAVPEIPSAPGLFVILSERDVTFRQIFTDGRLLPADPTPTWNGHRRGTGKGGVGCKTIGLRDGTWLDRAGSPMTDAARMTERFRRVSFGRLEIDATIDDPKAYTRPWTVTLVQRIVPDTDLLDYHCNDNEKDTAHMIFK